MQLKTPVNRLWLKYKSQIKHGSPQRFISS
uniref:Uncharacterized protein n=1 Tax=Tetranychus urticae TaxID=32264 RepID=T1KCD0_TETUR